MTTELETKYRLLKDFVRRLVDIEEELNQLGDEAKELYQSSNTHSIGLSTNQNSGYFDIQIKLSRNSLQTNEVLKEQFKTKNMMKAFVETDDLILAKLQGE
jgi:hypothetical protein